MDCIRWAWYFALDLITSSVDIAVDSGRGKQDWANSVVETSWMMISTACTQPDCKPTVMHLMAHAHGSQTVFELKFKAQALKLKAQGLPKTCNK